VRFKGGLLRTLKAPLALNGWKKYQTAPEVIAQIDQLLNEHTDAQVAAILNEQGRASGRRLTFNGEMVAALRKRHGLQSRYERLRATGLLDITEMAELLGTCQRTIYEWHKKGLLQGHQYNKGGACLYEAPPPDSLLSSPARPFRRTKQDKESSTVVA